MKRQLVLLEGTEADWLLDEATKELGLRNVAKARKALVAARQEANARRDVAAA